MRHSGPCIELVEPAPQQFVVALEGVSIPVERTVKVPTNTEAEVVLPDGRAMVVRPGSATFHSI